MQFIFLIQQIAMFHHCKNNILTTTKAVIYDAQSTTVLENCLRIWSGDNFVISRIKLVFYVVHSKRVINNRHRMSAGDNLVITIN